ncbi:wall associated kinase-like 4 [Striga asiatica]|uniref:Wall associated kinase-like 4 n=1 Tax=Striga asiatica TaxID=4170 RepID=A0A5A7RA26_STRAF|nr:wall associated kinase-like 4 [Striga asiatica]
MGGNKSSSNLCLLTLALIPHSMSPTKARKSPLLRTSCSPIPINFPFGKADGFRACSPYYQHQVCNMSYSDPHLMATDPYIWACWGSPNFRSFGMDPQFSRPNTFGTFLA